MNAFQAAAALASVADSNLKSNVLHTRCPIIVTGHPLSQRHILALLWKLNLNKGDYNLKAV